MPDLKEHKYHWNLVKRINGGHSFWRDEKTNRVSCCDESGPRPHLTDDGVLWLNTEKPIVISQGSGRINIMASVIDSEDTVSSIICDLGELLYLVRFHGMKTVIKDGIDQATLYIQQ